MRGKRIWILLLLLALLAAFSACGQETVGGYVVSETGLDNRVLSIGCREGDPLMDILIAALQVRAADGTVAQLSRSWFGGDVTSLKGDSEALTGLDIPQDRILVLGYDASSLPFSGTDDQGHAIGFEIELAESVCALLGWELRALAVDVTNADVELASGNVDCIWGGASLSDAGGLRVLSYMETEYVLISLAEAPVKRLNALNGKILSYPSFAGDAVLSADLASVADTAAALASTQACLTALDAGRCDAVLTDALAAAYYIKD